MNNENYITIQGWMRNELKLKGNDLIVYAIIYGFSQTENQRFTGSLQYLADWCGATKQGILKNLKNLLNAGLIKKEASKKGVLNSVEYYATQFNGVLNSVECKTQESIKLSLTNNTNKLFTNVNSNKDNKDDSIHKEKSVKDLTNIVLDSYAELCPNLPQVRAVTDVRKKAIERIANKYGIDTIQEVFRKANESEFLQGKNDTGWKGNLDFLLREDKFIATLEGRYDNHKLSGGRKVEGIVMNQESYTDEERAEIKRKMANGEYERI